MILSSIVIFFAQSSLTGKIKRANCPELVVRHTLSQLGENPLTINNKPLITNDGMLHKYTEYHLASKFFSYLKIEC